jgi:hypothetical protein
VTLSTRWAAALLVAAAVSIPGHLAAQAAAPQALILSPEAGERVPADQVLVAVTLPAGADSVTLRVGSRDATAEAQVADGVLTWRPATPLPTGPQRVVVAMRGAEPLAWTFTVAPAERAVAAAPGAPQVRRPSRAVPHGTVVMEGGGHSFSGPGADFAREKEFLPQLWVNAGGELGSGWRYGVRSYVSGYESRTAQPVNRFRGDLRGSWLSLAVGDVNPVLQDVILAGQHVRGGQLDLRAGPLRLDLVAGRTGRAIPGALDPLDPTLIGRQGTFAQNLVAVRPSIGAGDRFRVGLTVMHVRDDLESIPELRTAADSAAATLPVNPAPRDNLVGGLDVSLRLLGGRFTARYENAASLYNRDITERPETEAELDSIFATLGADSPGIDPGDWDRFIILNGSLIPLDPSKLTNVAHQVRTTVRAGRHTVSGEWRSVGVDYYTLGHPGLQRDYRGWRIRDSFSFPGDALFVTAGFESDRDNLDGSALATTTNRGAFATVTWQAPREMLFTGSFRLGTRGNDLAASTPGALDQTTHTLTAAAQVPVALFPAFRTRVSLNGSYISRSDPANPLADTRDLYFLAGIQGETLDRDMDLSLLAGQNVSDFPELDGGSTTFDRLVLAGRRRLSERWTARFDGAFTNARSPSTAAVPGPRYTRTEALGGGEFTWRQDTAITFTAGVVSYADKRVPALDTRELVARIRLSQAF